MTLDEGSGVRPPDQFHVAGPGPAHGHHEHPDAVLPSILADVGKASPVHLGLLSGRCLKPHRRVGVRTPPPAGAYVLHKGRVAPLVSPGPQLPQQHDAVLQPFGHPPVDVLGVGV